MQITSRTDAILAVQNKYFTGKPCKNGHIAERYVQSGSCEICVHTATASKKKLSLSRELVFKHVQLMKERRELALIRAQMKPLRVELHLEDMDYFKAVAYGISKLREPRLFFENILTKFNPTFKSQDTWSCSFKLFPEDHAAFIHIAKDLKWNRMTPKEQEFLLKYPLKRPDGWVPPPLR